MADLSQRRGPAFLGGGGGGIGFPGLPPISFPPIGGGGGGGGSAPGGYQATLPGWPPNGTDVVCGKWLSMKPYNNNQDIWVELDCASFPRLTAAQLALYISNNALSALLALTGVQSSPTDPLAVSTGQGNGGAGPINITINDSLSNLSGILAGITGTISSSTQQQVGSINTAAEGVGNAVANALGQFVGGLTNFTSVSTGNIVSQIGGLINSLFNPGSGIQGALGGDIQELTNLVRAVEGIITGSLNPGIRGLADASAGLTAAVTSEIGGLTTAINSLVTGFLSGIPDVLNNIEKVWERIAGIWTNIHSTLDIGNIHKDLQKIADEIAGIAKKTIGVAVDPEITLSDTCDLSAINDKIKNMGSVEDRPEWEQVIINALMWVVLQTVNFAAIAKKTIEIGEENANEHCQITKLDPATTVQAWRRNIVTEDSALDDLRKQGYSRSRAAALYGLTAYLEDPGTIADHWFRNLLTDGDMATILKQQGYSDPQIQSFKAALTRIGDIGQTLTGYLRGTLTEDELRLVLRTNRFDDAQQDLFIENARRPPTTIEALTGEHTRDLLGSVSLAGIPIIGTDFDTVPQWFKEAGKAEGLDDTAIQQRWWGHWNLGNAVSWIQMYFRGERNLLELQNALDAFNVPRTLQIDLVNVNRPLIPFRTIPGMVKAGILSEGDARKRLEAHGFSNSDIDVLLKFATAASKATTAAPQATKQHGVSLAATQELYKDGAIDEKQYRDILAAHGFDEQAIDLEVELENLNNALAARRAAGQDIVNEYEAGLIDLPTAQQQLAQQNFTVAEQAKYLRQLKTQKTKASKLPDEGTLNHWLQKSIITPTEYHDALIALGYSEVNTQRYLTWRSAPTSPSSSPTASGG